MKYNPKIDTDNLTVLRVSMNQTLWAILRNRKVNLTMLRSFKKTFEEGLSLFTTTSTYLLTKFTTLLAVEVQATMPVIDRLSRDTNKLKLLSELLTNSEFAEIIANPNSSSFSKQWARTHLSFKFSELESSLLLSRTYCFAVLSEYNIDNAQLYVQELKKRDLFHDHLRIVLHNKRLPVFYILDMKIADIALQYLTELPEALANSLFPAQMNATKKIMLGDKKHLFRLCCRIGSVPLIDSLVKTLRALSSPEKSITGPLFSPTFDSFPIAFVFSTNSSGVMPLHIALMSKHFTLATQLLDQMLNSKISLVYRLFSMFILKKNSNITHTSLLHLICQLIPEEAVLLLNKLHDAYGERLIRQLSTLDSTTQTALFYIKDKAQQDYWQTQISFQQNTCNKILCLDLDDTMVNNSVYLFPNLFSALIRYSHFKKIPLYVITLSLRDSLMLGNILSTVLNTEPAIALGSISGYFCRSMSFLPEYSKFLSNRDLKTLNCDGRKHIQAEFLAHHSGYDITKIQFCIVDDNEGIIQQANIHNHIGIIAKTKHNDPTCILTAANFCGLTEENIHDYDATDPIVSVINTLRAISPNNATNAPVTESLTPTI